MIIYPQRNGKESFLAKIKIIATPPGFAPVEIREQWVGVEIPLVNQEEISRNPPSSLGIGNDNPDGHLVLTDAAIDALRRVGKGKAADFWEGIPLGTYLQFRRDVCEVISNEETFGRMSEPISDQPSLDNALRELKR